MPRFKKQLILKPKSFQADFRILTKKNRVQLRASFPKDEFEIVRQPIKWEVIYQDEECKLITSIARQDTNYVLNGERVFMLIFKDGRRLRIKKNDLPERKVRKLNKAINVVILADKLSTIHETLA